MTSKLELDATRAPATVANFLKYVDAGFYNGGSFHRTVRPAIRPDEKLPDPGGPGRHQSGAAAQIDSRPIALERTKDTGVWHVEGAISMARTGPDTAQSDFFICLEDLPSLDYGGLRNPDGEGFAAFGRVVRGLDVARKIQVAPADAQRLTPSIRIIKIARKPLGVSTS